MANGHINLMVAGLVGAFMTSLYTFRMIFIVFHGKEQIHAHAGKGITHHLPLIVLLVLSTFVGALIVPPLEGVLPQTTELAHGSVMTLEIASGFIAIAGILIAAWLWLGKRTLVTSIANSAPGRFFGTWWFHAWGFDWLYDKVFVKPFLGIAWLLKSDPLNALMNIPAILSRFAGKGLLVSENGYLRWYVASMSIGAVVVLAVMSMLLPWSAHAQELLSDGHKIIVLACLLGYFAFNGGSLSVVTWLYCAEIFPLGVRGKGTALCSFALWVVNFLVTLLLYFTADALGIGLVFGALAAVNALAWVFVWRYAPETRGRTLEDIEQSLLNGQFNARNAVSSGVLLNKINSD